MDKKSGLKLLLLFLVIVLFAINYPLLDKLLKNSYSNFEFGVVERVIDGDTVVINGSSVRLLGINSPERGEAYYGVAKNYLTNLTTDNLVKLERTNEDQDRYGRDLRYLFLEDKNVNLELVEKGYANYYFPSGKGKYYNEFQNAWLQCIANEVNLCQKSQDICVNCIKLKKFNPSAQEIILENVCSFDCDLANWNIKDEGRKKFNFFEFILKGKSAIKILVGEEKSTSEVLYWRGEKYVWTSTGDTLFLRDSEGKLVLWKSY